MKEKTVQSIHFTVVDDVIWEEATGSLFFSRLRASCDSPASIDFEPSKTGRSFLVFVLASSFKGLKAPGKPKQTPPKLN
jgi:hypothetical protein